jgi:hypothetical protein
MILPCFLLLPPASCSCLLHLPPLSFPLLQSPPPAPQHSIPMIIRNTACAVCVCLLVFVCAFVGEGQSGRRQSRVEPAAPVPTPTPEPTPKPKAEQKEPELIFLVGADRNRSYSMFPFTFYDAALSGCSNVLRRGSSAQVDVSDRDLPRGDAIKKAKSNAKTYVVLMELRADTMTGSQNSQSYDQLVLEYVVFSPLTAKIATSGRTYQNANRKGPVIVGPTGGGPSGVLYREQLLKRAGEEAGERILRSLHLSTPRTN